MNDRLKSMWKEMAVSQFKFVCVRVCVWGGGAFLEMLKKTVKPALEQHI